MSELDEFHSQITSSLSRLSSLLSTLSKKDYSERQSSLRKADQLKRTIKDLIESFELEINSMDRNQQGVYMGLLSEVQTKFEELKKELEFRRREEDGRKELIGVREDGEGRMDTNDMNGQQLIELGNQKQAEGNLALDNIIARVEEGNKLAGEINLELDGQIEQLDRMEQTLKDTQSVLKRAQALIRYFFRQIYTDKIIMCMICCIFLAILIIVILSAVGLDKDGRFNVSDIIK